jgi:hypothetical protein
MRQLFEAAQRAGGDPAIRILQDGRITQIYWLLEAME